MCQSRGQRADRHVALDGGCRNGSAQKHHRNVHVVFVQRARQRYDARALFDPARHQVDRHVARAFRVEAVLHLFAVSFAEIAALHIGRRERARYAAELKREGCRTGLYLGQIESVFVDQLAVQIKLSVAVAEHPLARLVLRAEKAVHDDLELLGVEQSHRDTALFAERVAAPVVRGQSDHDFSRLELGLDESDQLADLAVELIIHVLDFDRAGAEAFADQARRIVADRQQVGVVVLAQFFLHDRLAGEAADQRIACGHVLQHGVVRPRIVLFEYPDDAAQKVSDARLGVGNEAEHGGVGVPVRLERLVGCPFPIEQRRSESRLVVFFDPVGQFFEIITARYPCAVSRVHPVDVRRRPSANDSRIGIGSQRDRFRFRVAFLEPVAQRGGGQVQCRVAALAVFALESSRGCPRSD